MKFKRNFKKLLAVVCVMALTVTSITFTQPQEVKADTEWVSNNLQFTITDSDGTSSIEDGNNIIITLPVVEPEKIEVRVDQDYIPAELDGSNVILNKSDIEANKEAGDTFLIRLEGYNFDDDFFYVLDLSVDEPDEGDDDDGIVLDQDIPSIGFTDSGTKLGGYTAYAFSYTNATAIGGVDPDDEDHIAIKPTSGTLTNPSGITLSKDIEGLKPNTDYTVSIDIYCDSGDEISVECGSETVVEQVDDWHTFNISCKSNSYGGLHIAIYLGEVTIGTIVEVDGVYVYDGDDELVYPADDEEETTEEVTTEEPTTEEVTTEENTTEEVTTEENTTEEVTTEENTTEEVTTEEDTTEEVTTEEITTEEITTEEITTEEPTTEAPTEKPTYNYDEMVSGDTNLALKATAKDVGTHREGTVAQLNDGVIDKWANYDAITVDAEHPSGAFDIALDKAYAASSIDQVAIWWRTADVQFVPQQGYKVQFGYNGVFTTVATVTKADYPTEGTTGGWVDEARFVTDTDFTNARVEGNVDTIRILIDTSVEWGAQVREIGVFASDPQEPEAFPQADAPAGITASSPDYGMIAYTITAGENQDDYTYNVYDGETLIGENVEAGTEYVVSGIASGMHTLKAVSVVPGYDPSEAVYSDEFAVEDIADLFGTTLNISTLATVASVSSFYNDDYTLEKASVAIDGTPTPGEGSNACIRTGANTDADIVIELDKDYYVKGLKKVLLAYTNPRTYAANTKISVSADGENYTELTSASGFKPAKDGSIDVNPIDLPVSESTDTFKYVKVSLSGGVSAWGYVLNEIGIIYNNTNNIPAVEGLVNVPGAEGEISYEFAWNADADAIEYNVYVDGKYTTTVLDSTVDLESVLSKAKPGRHTVSIKAVAEDGSESVNAASIEFNVPEPPTESTTEAPSTEAPSTEAPTQAPGTITDLDISIAAQEEKDPTQKVGGYDIYAGSWNNSTAVAGVDPEDADHIKIAAKSSNWSDAWGLQVQKNIAGLDPKTAYTYEIAIKSDNNDGKVKITGSNAEIPVTGAAQTLAGTVETDEDGHAMVAIGMGWVGLNNGIEVYSVTLKDADGNIVYPGGDEPTTEAPTGDTTEAPTGDTTEAPTQVTTQAPTGDTTVAPTDATTAAPATTAKKIAKPGKTKIKKVFKKKKSAKKLKIKVKKAKGANGYQVAVFKTKKNAKKNKAFFKKYFKKNKATFTITHKKLKKIKKTFYVKVRAYNKDANGKVQYSSWTKAKKAKVK